MNPFTFDFYFRVDQGHGNSVVKVEIHNGSRWLTKHEKIHADVYNAPMVVASMLRVTKRLLMSYGMKSEQVELLLSGKQVFLPVVMLPLAQLAQLGWNVKPYPHKFLVPDDPAEMLEDVALSGLSLDVSNIVAQERFFDTEGRVLKGVVDTLDDLEVKTFLYVDYKLWGKLLDLKWYGAYDYLKGFYEVQKPWRRIVTSKEWMTADEIMLKWADCLGNHILSRDEFDEFDMKYDWVLYGASRGYPRLHKFVRKGNDLYIPDLDIEAAIPPTF